jgi:hypothetical protein
MFGDRDFIGDNYWSEGSFARRRGSLRHNLVCGGPSRSKP